MSKYLTCSPDYFGIQYEINPWMDKNNESNHQKSQTQWDTLQQAIVDAGGKTINIDPQPDLPDLVFTANAGLILKDLEKVILSSFKHQERNGEEPFFEKFFENHGFTVIKPNGNFEGAGDALFLDETLICGTGFRSDLETYKQLLNDGHLDEVKFKIVNLVDNRFYHLDTCFCPLNDKDYLIYPGAFDEVSLENIRELSGNEICVPENEAAMFACNAVLVDETVILPNGCPKTIEQLLDFGYKVSTVEMTEFMKSGGACKCLTLKLN